jgi:peptidoglycan/xylan/chitin deacetylase (PgdA/CDA1 family)
MSLRSGIGAVRRALLSSLATRPAKFEVRGPVVSFCFDDFPRTALTVGGAILKAAGAKGTYYAAPALMNTTNQLGEQFTRNDVDALLADGHELASHTFSHISCRKHSLESFMSDVRRGRQTLVQMAGEDSGNFAYPFGHVTLKAKLRIGAAMSSCRGTYGGLNEGRCDLNLLRANSLYGDVDGLAAYLSMLSLEHLRTGWLIFYSHDIRNSPSAFGCTPALLQKVVEHTVARGLRIAPVREVMANISPSPALRGQEKAPAVPVSIV